MMKKVVALLLTAVLSLGCASAVFAEEAPAENEALVGGWAVSEDNAVDEQAKAVLEKAQEGLVGATYEPVVLLATQVVAGTNYCYLCKVTPVTANPVSSYAIVYVYEDLSGNAEISEVQDIELGLSPVEDLAEESTESAVG